MGTDSPTPRDEHGATQPRRDRALARGSMETTPARFLMCPPDHYEVSYTINPWMDPARWSQNRRDRPRRDRALARGSMETTPARFLMCPPDHYEVSYTINPWMDPARWSQNR